MEVQGKRLKRCMAKEERWFRKVLIKIDGKAVKSI
jgi:hypothetical protein